MRRLLLFVLLMSLVISYALAQDTGDEGAACDYAALAADIRDYADRLVETDDPESLLAQMTERISLFRIDCLGLTYNSLDDGFQPVIGPIELPEGFYRISASAEGRFIVQFDLLDGECELVNDSSNVIFNVTERGATGTQKTLESSGCLIEISVRRAADPWTMTFERVR